MNFLKKLPEDPPRKENSPSNPHTALKVAGYSKNLSQKILKTEKIFKKFSKFSKNFQNPKIFQNSEKSKSWKNPEFWENSEFRKK